jgi:hypothetical protein
MKLFKNLALCGGMLLAGCIQTKPWGRAEFYYDTRGMSSATIRGGATDLPLGTDFFGFIDEFSKKDNLDNLQDPYLEAKLYRKIEIGDKNSFLGRSFGPAVEYDRDFVLSRGIARLGLTFEPNLSQYVDDLFLGTNIYPFASENAGVQIGLYGFKGFLDRKFILDGFIDVNPQDRKPKIVTELLGGVSFMNVWEKLKDFYMVSEVRYNDYLEDRFGVGFGLAVYFK